MQRKYLEISVCTPTTQIHSLPQLKTRTLRHVCLYIVYSNNLENVPEQYTNQLVYYDMLSSYSHIHMCVVLVVYE